MTAAVTSAGCPCGSGAAYDACCGPIIEGTQQATTAEALMRSRFTAFARGDIGHITRTYAEEKRAEAIPSAGERRSSEVEWIGLEVLETVAGGPEDNVGIVEFAAHYRRDGAPGVHRERSNFRRDDGRWVYVDGAPDVGLAASRKVGRNAPCPCGSGKKFKKCCGA